MTVFPHSNHMLATEHFAASLDKQTIKHAESISHYSTYTPMMQLVHNGKKVLCNIQNVGEVAVMNASERNIRDNTLTFYIDDKAHVIPDRIFTQHNAVTVPLTASGIVTIIVILNTFVKMIKKEAV